MSPPNAPVEPTWDEILVEPFSALILGQRGSGKTALGHLLMEEFGGPESDRDAYIMGFPDNRHNLLPDWVEVLPATTGMHNWPTESVVLLHEAHHLIHARRAMNTENLSVDNLVTVSRHKDSNIIFETQQSQRLDRNAVTAVDAVIFREPALLQADFERKQVRQLVERAEEIFDQYVETVKTDSFTWRERSEEVKKHAYIYSGRFEGEYPHNIPLPDHWTEEISKAYGDVDALEEGPIEAKNGEGVSNLDDEEMETLNAVAEWEREHRPLEYDHEGAEHDDVSISYAWNKLSQLCELGFLEKTYSSNNSTQYRLTGKGWDKTDVEKPDVPLFAEDVS